MILLTACCLLFSWSESKNVFELYHQFYIQKSNDKDNFTKRCGCKLFGKCVYILQKRGKYCKLVLDVSELWLVWPLRSRGIIPDGSANGSGETIRPESTLTRTCQQHTDISWSITQRHASITQRNARHIETCQQHTDIPWSITHKHASIT
jgi:hypothetical protein